MDPIGNIVKRKKGSDVLQRCLCVCVGGGEDFSESAGGYVFLPFRACSSKNKTVNPCIHIFWLSIDIEETNEVADERTE